MTEPPLKHDGPINPADGPVHGASLNKEIEQAMKRSVFYGIQLSAWMWSRMAIDRALVWMSAGAVALTVIMLRFFGLPTGGRVCAIAALVVFAGVIVMCLEIFRLNAAYLMAEIRGESDADNKRERLKALDQWARLAYGCGLVILVVLAGLS